MKWLAVIVVFGLCIALFAREVRFSIEPMYAIGALALLVAAAMSAGRRV